MMVQDRCGQFSVQNRVGDIVTKLLLVTKKKGPKNWHALYYGDNYRQAISGQDTVLICRVITYIPLNECD